MTAPLVAGRQAAPTTSALPSAHNSAALFVVGAFVLYVAMSLFGVAGRLLSITYPAGCAIVALFCYVRSPATYLGFTFWVWIITPCARRIYDLHYGFHPTSSLLIAPLAVSIVAAFTLLRRRQLLRSSAYIPFLVATAALAYSFLIGIIRQSAVAAAYDLMAWIAPLLFGMHVALEWRDFPQARKTMTNCVLWGLLVTSLYAIAQFVNPAVWDRAWVVNAEMFSVGAPLPFVIRVFSTLNAPGPFSVMLVFALLFGLSAPQAWRTLPIALGLVAFMLNKGRSAWGAFALGLVLMQLRQPLRSLPRQWAALLGVAILASPLIFQPRVLQTFTSRAATLGDVEQDHSFKSRITFTRVALGALATNPAGSGLGGLGGATKLLLGTKSAIALDSAPLEIYAIMGWLGGTLFMMSLVAVVLPIARARKTHFDPVTSAAAAVVVALVFTSLFGNIFNSTSGFFFWLAVGLGTSGRTYANAVDLMARYANHPSTLARTRQNAMTAA